MYDRLADVARYVREIRRCLAHLLAYVRLYHGHAVRGQGAGLVRANGGGVTHRFAGVQVAHQIVVLHHFLHRETDGLKGEVCEKSRRNSCTGLTLTE